MSSRAVSTRAATTASLSLLLVALLAVGLGGCGTERDSAADAADRVPPLWPSSVTSPAAGYHRVACPRVKGAGPGRTVTAVVPDSYRADYAEDGDCQFASKAVSIEIVVAPDGSLADYKAKEVDPYVGEGGDEEVFHPVYARDVTDAVGGRTGETLGFGIANDGEGGDLHLAQADGVRLRLDTDDGDYARHRAEFQRICDSVGVATAKRAPGSATPSGEPSASTSRVG